ncbi:MAG: hypothetical protein KAX65_08395 [Caldilineaceae bacterium]|nr:hypothetical protein [Caldilineaceae bacterium]
MTTAIQERCPHCNRGLAYNPTQHIELCPANPAQYDAYRAALEDPARPGVQREKPDYEAHRGLLYSGTILLRTWDCGWGDVAEHFGLARREAEPRKPIRWLDKTLREEGPKIDQEIARNRAIERAVGEIGLAVLRTREVAHDGRVYEYHLIR